VSLRSPVPGWRAVFFDLDGTLLDTRPGVRAAVVAAFTEVTGRNAAGARIDLSLPLDQMIRDIDPSASPARQLQLSAAFRRLYDETFWLSADVYPGAASCLHDLRAAGVRSFVVTNKRGHAAERLLEHFDLEQYIEGVEGQAESGESLPKSALAGRCLAAAGLDPAATIVIGDSDQDASMAEFWRMTFVAVTSGTGPLGHAQPGSMRVEVASLADAGAYVLRRSRGGSREP
jgi:phosphoglycolate phosphatase-like HAD superfamily hydrolase